MILGAFYYGYSCSTFIGGRLSEIYGSRWVLFITVGLTSLLTTLNPLAARFSTRLFIVTRALQGATQVSIYNLLHIRRRTTPRLFEAGLR